MGSTGEKPKFDLITASKSKKYKIITAVILVLGVLLLLGGALLRTLNTAAVAPNTLSIAELSGMEPLGQFEYECTLSIDQLFVVATGTPQDRALSEAIIFTLDADAAQFVEVRDRTNTHGISASNYQGLFHLHIRDDAPEFFTDDYGAQSRPTGYLKITCGSYVIRVKLTYQKIDA